MLIRKSAVSCKFSGSAPHSSVGITPDGCAEGHSRASGPHARTARAPTRAQGSRSGATTSRPGPERSRPDTAVRRSVTLERSTPAGAPERQPVRWASPPLGPLGPLGLHGPLGLQSRRTLPAAPETRTPPEEPPRSSALRGREVAGGHDVLALAAERLGRAAGESPRGPPSESTTRLAQRR